MIETAYLERALNWSAIKPEDRGALQRYALFLRGCCKTMEDLQYMEDMNSPYHKRTIASKLPFKIRETWRTVACKHLERIKARARFPHLLTFINRYVKIIFDLVFGDIQAVVWRENTAPKNTRSGVGIAHKRSSFATIAAVEDGIQCERSGEERPTLPCCLCCSGSHGISACREMSKKSHTKRWNC